MGVRRIGISLMSQRLFEQLWRSIVAGSLPNVHTAHVAQSPPERVGSRAKQEYVGCCRCIEHVQSIWGPDSSLLCATADNQRPQVTLHAAEHNMLEVAWGKRGGSGQRGA